LSIIYVNRAHATAAQVVLQVATTLVHATTVDGGDDCSVPAI
jgi:hypothetical protein